MQGDCELAEDFGTKVLLCSFISSKHRSCVLGSQCCEQTRLCLAIALWSSLCGSRRSPAQFPSGLCRAAHISKAGMGGRTASGCSLCLCKCVSCCCRSHSHRECLDPVLPTPTSELTPDTAVPVGYRHTQKGRNCSVDSSACLSTHVPELLFCSPLGSPLT